MFSILEMVLFSTKAGSYQQLEYPANRCTDELKKTLVISGEWIYRLRVDIDLSDILAIHEYWYHDLRLNRQAAGQIIVFLGNV